ncbi:polysaccharide deacetylase family protein [Rhizomonospora bruguierae]|uniref:polysaccharide deacetylase family protein n=1 Tax=Rhizomonospora bruguierae TaxID=1581705 RepID=UPI0020C00389|nr:polysaccharide deacetylase family protein [Micromonospora sp. NBRC 107566]
MSGLDGGPRLSRRAALRGVAGLGAAALAGCDAATPAPPPSAPQAPPQAVPSAPAPRTAAPSPGQTDAPIELVHGPRDRSYVALTFHGQGDPAITRRVLATLADAGAGATVLAVGTWLREHPEVARWILDGGHELGNHTEHHLAIATLAPGRAFTEIDKCGRTLRRLTGSPGRWFRPSQTRNSTPAIRAAAARAGYSACVSYDVDSLDYTDPGPGAITRTTLGAVRNGSIVSLHLGHEDTVTALPGILDGLRTRGLSAVTMSELVSR